jgi:hypothetical protein
MEMGKVKQIEVSADTPEPLWTDTGHTEFFDFGAEVLPAKMWIRNVRGIAGQGQRVATFKYQLGDVGEFLYSKDINFFEKNKEVKWLKKIHKVGDTFPSLIRVGVLVEFLSWNSDNNTFHLIIEGELV